MFQAVSLCFSAEEVVEYSIRWQSYLSLWFCQSKYWLWKLPLHPSQIL